jgi:L-asparaginase
MDSSPIQPSSLVSQKNVLIIGTGGTIAGSASSGTSAIYESGAVGVEDLIQACPGVESLAKLSIRSLLSKDSADMTKDDWRLIACEVMAAISNPSVDAIVITHGSDTLEETAFFLDLVIPLGKPVVLVAAMRPATSLSPDGPMNLYDAIAVAADSESNHRGVLVVMNNEIFLARHVTKSHTGKLNTFISPSSGPVGQVIYGKPRYFWPPLGNGPYFASSLDLSGPILFPLVAIWHCHADVDPELAEIQIASGKIKGLVLAGFGDGNIPASLRALLKPAHERDITIVRSTRVAGGLVTPDYNQLDSTYGLICARSLNPQKARILLMLALIKARGIPEIQALFDCY